MNMNLDNEIGIPLQRVLGRGAFATVYYSFDSQTSNAYAVKVFHKKDFTKHRLKSFRKQAEILNSIEHKNVVKFKSFKETDSSLYLIMEYIPGVTLKQLISEREKKKTKFTDNDIAVILKSILEGIKYLHKLNIIHRDLKPENILVSDPGDLSSIKIVDFGLSAQIESGSPSHVKSQCGTLLYMAPEILYEPSYSKAVDIWACAVIMFILCKGHHPLYKQGMKSQQFKQKLKNCTFPSLDHPLADNFMKNLSKIDYTQRYSVNEALRHPWITRNEDDEIPLSVNESIHSFDTSNTISDALKFICTINQFYMMNKKQVPADYAQKVLGESLRESNSYKKGRSKARERLITIKQLIIKKQKQMQHLDYESSDPESPVLMKHKNLFTKLFEKQKQDTIQTIFIDCKKVENIYDEEKRETEFFKNGGEQAEDERKKITNSQKLEELAQLQQANFSSISGLSCSTLISTRNNLTQQKNHFDVDLPLIKSKNSKKEKQTREGIRKMNSLREEGRGKFQFHYNYFKTAQKLTENMKEQRKNQNQREGIGLSKMKRISSKQEHLYSNYSNKNTLKKPQTAERGKNMSKNKQYKPFIFGVKGGHN